MIIRSSKEDVQEYVNSPALNQSKLKLLGISAQAFQDVKEPEMFFEEKEHFVIGKGVDNFITMGEPYFDEHYYVSRFSKPSAVIMSIVQELFANRNTNVWLDIPPDDILNIIVKHEYQPNWKPETKIKKISEEGEMYWFELCESEGKNILSIEQYSKIMSIITQLITHEYTKELFVHDAHEDAYYQMPIYFEVEGVLCKALLDMVIVNHETKEVIPYDIKTIGDYTKFFDYQSFKRRYDIQAAWYSEGLYQWMINNYPDYNLCTFRFIVASTTQKCDPLVFTTTVSFLNAGKFGFMKEQTYFVNGEEVYADAVYKGWKQLIEEYKWHEENSWSCDYEAFHHNGNFELSASFKRD